MGNGIDKILPGLYVGNFRDSRDEEQLKENKITHIVSIHDNAKPFRSDMIYLCINAEDVGSQDLQQFFTQCNDFIHSARLFGGSVLVHCLAGMSRSVTVTVAYIMTVTSLGWRDALKVVKASRTCASPNFGFQKQLLAFQHERVSEEKSRLLSSHPSQTLPEDEIFCQKQLDEFECQEIVKKHKENQEDLVGVSVPCCHSDSTKLTPSDAQQLSKCVDVLDEMFMLPNSTARSSLVITLKKSKTEAQDSDSGTISGMTSEESTPTLPQSEPQTDSNDSKQVRSTVHDPDLSQSETSSSRSAPTLTINVDDLLDSCQRS